MSFWLKYLQTWLIIKKKTYGKYFSKSSCHYTKFAIVCAPRSGSNWLHTLLNSHPNIISKGEILRTTYELNQSLQLKTLNQLVFNAQHASIKAIGLKLFYHYLNDRIYGSYFQEIIDNPTILIIHLRRNNLLAQYTSLKKAELTNKWSHSAITTDYSSIKVNKEEFLLYQKNQLEIQNTISTVFVKHRVVEVCYEDLQAQPEKVLLELQQFLNVKPSKLFSLLQKQSSAPLKDQISNWNDFKDII